jgi:hypothetical protein
MRRIIYWFKGLIDNTDGAKINKIKMLRKHFSPPIIAILMLSGVFFVLGLYSIFNKDWQIQNPHNSSDNLSQPQDGIDVKSNGKAIGNTTASFGPLKQDSGGADRSRLDSIIGLKYTNSEKFLGAIEQEKSVNKKFNYLNALELAASRGNFQDAHFSNYYLLKLDEIMARRCVNSVNIHDSIRCVIGYANEMVSAPKSIMKDAYDRFETIVNTCLRRNNSDAECGGLKIAVNSIKKMRGLSYLSTKAIAILHPKNIGVLDAYSSESEWKWDYKTQDSITTIAATICFEDYKSAKTRCDNILHRYIRNKYCSNEWNQNLSDKLIKLATVNRERSELSELAAWVTMPKNEKMSRKWKSRSDSIKDILYQKEEEQRKDRFRDEIYDDIYDDVRNEVLAGD